MIKTVTTSMKAALIVGVTLLVLLLSPTSAQAPTQEVGKNSNLSFAYDWSGQDVEGNAEIVDAVEFVFHELPLQIPPPPALRILRTTPIIVGENIYRVDDVLTDIPDGDYNITTRLRDLGGNWSAESVGIAASITSKNPNRPTGLRVVGR